MLDQYRIIIWPWLVRLQPEGLAQQLGDLPFCFATLKSPFAAFYSFWSPSHIELASWIPSTEGLFVVDLLAGQRRHHTVVFGAATETVNLSSSSIGHWCFDKMRRLCFCLQGKRCMFAAVIRCCIMAAVAKDTDTCVSPGHVSSAVSQSDMFCFSAKAPSKRSNAWCL